MKTNLLIIAIVATLVTACTTGTQMTRTYDDDIYFSPKDVPPVSMVQEDAADKKNTSEVVDERIVISQQRKNADGSRTLNNDIYRIDEGSDYQLYDMRDPDLVESDTTIYYNDDESVKYVINNYYEDEDIDFTYRINRFHRPYFYSSYLYDDWAFGYYPFYSGYYGWGYDPFYSYGWGWGYPHYYSPYAWGLGGYFGYGYLDSYFDGYYNGYYNGNYGGGSVFFDNHQVARRRSTEINMPGGRETSNVQGRSRTSVLKDSNTGNDSNQRLPVGDNSRSRSRVVSSTGTTDSKSATVINNRRSTTTSGSQVARQSSTISDNARRTTEPSVTGRTSNQSRVVKQTQSYTPSYNKPRIVNQSNYNSNTYSRSRTSSPSGNYERGAVKSGTIQGSSYSAPRSSSNMRQSYQSRSTYSSGSSSSSGGSYRISNSDNSRQSSGTYTPRSSGSYSSGSGGGGGYSGGSSGSSSGGGSGGGSGHRR